MPCHSHKNCLKDDLCTLKAIINSRFTHYREIMIFDFAFSGKSASFIETLSVIFTPYFSLIESSFSTACSNSSSFMFAMVRKLSKYNSSKFDDPVK